MNAWRDLEPEGSMRGERSGREHSPNDYIPPGEKIDPPTALRKMQIEWFDEAADSALADTTDPLIEGVLDEGALSVIYGDSNSGKTFVALDKAHCVSTGIPWNGKQTKHGLVIYVAAEGGKRIKRRLAALKRRYRQERGGDAPTPLFALIRFPIDLRSSDADLNELLRLVRAAESQKGAQCVWILVDTLSRAMAGGDENSPVDMGRIVSAADRIRAETSAHFTYVHHTGKDAARGARGHSLLRAATDTEIEVAPQAMTVTKQRDMEGGYTAAFSLVDLEIGVDANERPVRSAVVEWQGGQTKPDLTPKAEKAVPPAMRMLMEVIKASIEDDGKQVRPWGSNGALVDAAPDSAIRVRYYARVAEKADDDDDTKKLAERQRKNFNNAIKGAVARKLIMAAELEGQRWVWLP